MWCRGGAPTLPLPKMGARLGPPVTAVRLSADQSRRLGRALTNAAYKLERFLIRNGPGDLVTIITLGRLLTRKMGRKRNGLMGCEMWFPPDGVHLSREEYAELESADAFPDRLMMRAKE